MLICITILVTKDEICGKSYSTNNATFNRIHQIPLRLELQVRHLKIPKKIKQEIKFEPYMSVKMGVLKLRFSEKTKTKLEKNPTLSFDIN